ncbi:thioredoxin family protein [Turneriella parva]|uniref:Uncharacterized protein n=1 Tax=Turneriella parva (strain ATCC BAA-1111 / DSM 21527 / NCTC 11395 / H) TaxID=869212 RepID=I4B5T2_TURPD|nr:thioredoxin family protein [Turneriella parva]AFM12639.1 hypothetical protein Turpa_1992 [Turneriella parva DSM 21527]
MRQILAAFMVLGASVHALADRHPVEDTLVALPASVSIGLGGTARLSVEVTIPAGHHAYLRHANAKGMAIPIAFRAAPESGFQLAMTAQPKGVRVGDEFVLRGKGKFTLELSELAMNEFGRTYALPVKVRLQLCGEAEPAICYMPETIEKTISVNINAPEILSRTQIDTSLAWIDNRAAALDAAKLKKQNVFALISDPTRCGACVQLETKVLPNAAVNKLLREKFVLYRVPKNEYSHAPIKGRFGIPFYFVVSPEGQNLQKWVGVPGPMQFAQGIEPYGIAASGTPTATAATTNSIPLNSGGRECAVPLKQSYAFQATQKGEFKSAGNMRFVTNASAPGTYTVLTLDRTGEIDASNSARVVHGKLVVERYLGGSDLIFQCSAFGIAGSVEAQSLSLSVELR